jgi:hypothetical protein
MANKPTLLFSFLFTGDGVSSSIAIDLATGPIGYQAPSTNYPILNAALTTLPSAVRNVTAAPLTVNSATVALGILTVNFSAATTNGTLYQVYGFLEY